VYFILGLGGIRSHVRGGRNMLYVKLFILWLAAVVVACAFAKSASFRELDEYVENQKERNQ